MKAQVYVDSTVALADARSVENRGKTWNRLEYSTGLSPFRGEPAPWNVEWGVES